MIDVNKVMKDNPDRVLFLDHCGSGVTMMSESCYEQMRVRFSHEEIWEEMHKANKGRYKYRDEV